MWVQVFVRAGSDPSVPQPATAQGFTTLAFDGDMTKGFDVSCDNPATADHQWYLGGYGVMWGSCKNLTYPHIDETDGSKVLDINLGLTHKMARSWDVLGSALGRSWSTQSQLPDQRLLRMCCPDRFSVHRPYASLAQLLDGQRKRCHCGKRLAGWSGILLSFMAGIPISQRSLEISIGRVVVREMRSGELVRQSRHQNLWLRSVALS